MQVGPSDYLVRGCETERVYAIIQDRSISSRKADWGSGTWQGKATRGSRVEMASMKVSKPVTFQGMRASTSLKPSQSIKVRCASHEEENGQELN